VAVYVTVYVSVLVAVCVVVTVWVVVTVAVGLHSEQYETVTEGSAVDALVATSASNILSDSPVALTRSDEENT